MLGSIIGDIVGSRFEFRNCRSKDFEFFDDRCIFTDDTVCTVATMQWLIECRNEGRQTDYASILQHWCRRYDEAERSYGRNFLHWIENPKPYGSYGNGAGMRVAAVGMAFADEQQVLDYAKVTAEVSHNHREGIKGAQAIALAVYMAKKKCSQTEIVREIANRFGYDMNDTCDGMRETNGFDETCQITVPQAIICFAESHDYEDAIRNAISIGGDSDTIAAMTGGIAEAFYGGIPEKIAKNVRMFLPNDMLQVIDNFYATFSL